jgi:replicative DNA helicase
MIEPLVLAHLIKDEEYMRKCLPFLKIDYFTSPQTQHLFTSIESFIRAYKVPPTFDAIKLSIDQSSVSAQLHAELGTLLTELGSINRVDASRKSWLLNETEKFCKQRALYLAISKSITLVDKDMTLAPGVPILLKDALAVNFDTHIGHDYFEEYSQRYDDMHASHTRIPFDIDLLNTITNGGLIPKTLNIIVAGTNVGKSLFLCHVATSSIAQGKNVLYITLEMAEERIAQRIDANLLDISLDALAQLPKQYYETAFKQLRKRQVFGKLVIKEYPTSGAHSGHFRALIDELALKKAFVPDLLIIDYINICSSERFKPGGQTNSYSYIKAIAEELRGLAVECNVPCLSATQFNREGFDSSDPSLTNTSESFGLPQTADLQIALVTSEELDADGLLLVKQLKNRYADTTQHRKFTVKVDRSKMRIYNDPLQTWTSNHSAVTVAPVPTYPGATKNPSRANITF